MRLQVEMQTFQNVQVSRECVCIGTERASSLYFLFFQSDFSLSQKNDNFCLILLFCTVCWRLRKYSSMCARAPERWESKHVYRKVLSLAWRAGWVPLISAEVFMLQIRREESTERFSSSRLSRANSLCSAWRGGFEGVLTGAESTERPSALTPFCARISFIFNLRFVVLPVPYVWEYSSVLVNK